MEQIIHGDSLVELKKFADESVDVLVTDPPYGYSFMGKSWDKTLPDIGIFKECFRVLKAGSFVFVMSAPRSDVCARMMLMLEDAGFEIGFTPIYWTYASGFPKAMNIGKMVDKRNGVEPTLGGLKKYPDGTTARKTANHKSYVGSTETTENTSRHETLPTSPEVRTLDGSYGGFQPKPAVEVVIVAMKPLSEKTYVDQALKNGKGVTWLDDCRIGTNGGGQNGTAGSKDRTQWRMSAIPRDPEPKGRFPANLLVSDDVLNDGRITKSTGGHIKVGNSNKVYGKYDKETWTDTPADSGSYSRYFDLDAWAQTLPFLAVPKASKSEKNAGLEGHEDGSVKAKQSNFHPTVKPLKLMSYLITLGSRPGDVVLDPFLGSGTTALAAKRLNRGYIGIEREAEYVEIAKSRIKEVQTDLFAPTN